MMTKSCADCKVLKPSSDFYSQRCHAQGVMSYCKKCFNTRCQQRWVKRKLEAIAYLGSACRDCDLNLAQSHYAVFKFHHLDPAEKDADWSKLRLGSMAKIRTELAKCVLLCANCHRIRHAA